MHNIAEKRKAVHNSSGKLKFDYHKFLKWFPPKENDGAEITYPELTKEAYAIFPKAQSELIEAFISAIKLIRFINH
ncbi:hypothetical protein PsorP6_000473 [Peronosclerospora sorghi]|uniref:Uncharacterized protein n=1 Tax=Peronosclerospora sorghi TaxID=230839 RepID=A0ACC0WR88_9STRA|nr:hypothetical protein PsorP6_000473 [Peronosclerospora sorghi]